MKTCAKKRFLLFVMLENVTASKPVCPPPPVAVVNESQEGTTVNGKQNGESEAAADNK